MRKIIHIDMDCFYAAVEMRENPQLVGKPIAVGGRPESRGVVATCNYEAREFGVHSAMPMSQALKKCPNLTIIYPQMNLYRQVSKSIQSMFKDYSEWVQPLSLDEAFIDVSHCQKFKGSATLIAQAIRKRIFDEHQLTASAGIAPNKFLAKIASDWNKPNGQFVITPNQIDSFVLELPVKKIFGVGKVTNQKMKKLGLHTCKDLQGLSPQKLNAYFGKFGERLYSLCRGVDERPVRTDSLRKSLSVEDTFIIDKQNISECLLEVEKLYPTLVERFDKSQRKKPGRIKAVYIKLRFNNFKTTTAQVKALAISQTLFENLIETAWNRAQRPVRLIGLGIQFEDEEKMKLQLELPI